MQMLTTSTRNVESLTLNIPLIQCEGTVRKRLTKRKVLKIRYEKNKRFPSAITVNANKEQHIVKLKKAQ